MASRYIPPHLRGKAASSGENDPSPVQGGSNTGLARRRLSDLKVSSSKEHSQPLYTISELNRHYGSSLVHSTLRDSSKNPNQLGYVVLFRGANPKWSSEQTVFAHTNIHILPGYDDFKQSVKIVDSASSGDNVTLPKDGSDMAHRNDVDNVPVLVTPEIKDNVEAEVEAELANAIVTAGSTQKQVPMFKHTDTIPVYMQVAGSQHGRTFAFHGYFRLSNIEFLKPHSAELVRMLQIKWEIPQSKNQLGRWQTKPRERTRNPEAWAQSLKEEWAVLKFERVANNESLEDPKIEILPDEEVDISCSTSSRKSKVLNDTRGEIGPKHEIAGTDKPIAS